MKYVKMKQVIWYEIQGHDGDRTYGPMFAMDIYFDDKNKQTFYDFKKAKKQLKSL